jgi:hypothetical protein
MQQFLVYRPDPDALQGLLDRHPADALGAVLRLAWLEGLLREEIVGLTWEQVSFLDEAICLADRTVPLYGPMADYLLRLSGRQSSDSRFVVLADRTHQPLQPPSVSRMVRQALDEAGQTRVRLLDLRYDFILRMLESAGWQETSRVSGVELVTLRLHFAGYLSGGKIDAAPRTPSGAAPDEFRLRRLLQEEGTSAAGIVLRLTWLAGLEQQEIAALRWEQVERGRTPPAAVLRAGRSPDGGAGAVFGGAAGPGAGGGVGAALAQKPPAHSAGPAFQTGGDRAAAGGAGRSDPAGTCGWTTRCAPAGRSRRWPTPDPTAASPATS